MTRPRPRHGLPPRRSHGGASRAGVVRDPPEADGPEPISSELLRRRATEMQDIVQFSPPAPVAADSAESALELVFDQLVLDAARKSFPFEKKHRAQGAARRAYLAHNVPAGAVRERAAVRSGVFDGVFDFAVHNGRTVQLVQCWSFQLPNQADLAEQVKAWSWLVHEVRQAGGELKSTEGEVEVPAELDIFAIAIPPVSGAKSSAYEEAQGGIHREPRHRALAQRSRPGGRAGGSSALGNRVRDERRA